MAGKNEMGKYVAKQLQVNTARSEEVQRYYFDELDALRLECASQLENMKQGNGIGAIGWITSKVVGLERMQAQLSGLAAERKVLVQMQDALEVL